MTQSRNLKLVGMDPSLRNWGLAIATYNLDTQKLVIDHLATICPVLNKGKQVRQNSLDLESAFQLYEASYNACTGADAVFVEVPIGSQSARAMASYGLCVGVLGALRANGIPFFEVTPTEVKLASFGSKTATKKEMIKWAVDNHPKANWPLHKVKGTYLISDGTAEHMADAVATIYAGLAGNTYKQYMKLLNKERFN